jgi:hypothetical protein
VAVRSVRTIVRRDARDTTLWPQDPPWGDCVTPPSRCNRHLRDWRQLRHATSAAPAQLLKVWRQGREPEQTRVAKARRTSGGVHLTSPSRHRSAVRCDLRPALARDQVHPIAYVICMICQKSMRSKPTAPRPISESHTIKRASRHGAELGLVGERFDFAAATPFSVLLAGAGAVGELVKSVTDNRDGTFAQFNFLSQRVLLRTDQK